VKVTNRDKERSFRSCEKELRKKKKDFAVRKPNVGAGGKKYIHHIRLAFLHRQVERCLETVSCLRVDIQFLRQAQLEHIERATLSGNMQKSLGREKETSSKVFEPRSWPASSNR
jgi:hypothetical protein